MAEGARFKPPSYGASPARLKAGKPGDTRDSHLNGVRAAHHAKAAEGRADAKRGG
jgi:hypothetical protein